MVGGDWRMGDQCAAAGRTQARRLGAEDARGHGFLTPLNPGRLLLPPRPCRRGPKAWALRLRRPHLPQKLPLFPGGVGEQGLSSGPRGPRPALPVERWNLEPVPRLGLPVSGSQFPDL